MEKIFNKKNMQFIFGKVFIFAFCVLFMSLYNKFFDSSNSTIGIVLLTGLLMFLKNDFGFNKVSAAFSIIFLYLICIIAPVLANINPILGLLINFLAIFLILVISTKNIEQDNQLPFMLGYIFASGYVVTGDLFIKRIVSVLIIATLIAIVYFLKNRRIKIKVELGIYLNLILIVMLLDGI